MRRSRRTVENWISRWNRHGCDGLIPNFTGGQKPKIANSEWDKVVREVLEEPHVITGGCSSEIEAAMQLRHDSRELFGRHQLVVLRFADALEGMAEILARSAGLDSLTVITELRAAHTKGNPYVGIDVKERSVADMRQIGVFHPLTIKEQILNSAVETAILILRIGDVVLSNCCKHKDKANEPDHNRKLHKDYKLESLEVESEPTTKSN